MILEQQVTNQEFSKRLEELGVPQKSLWCWRKYSLKDEPFLFLEPSEGTELAVLSGNLEYKHSAFTVAELGSLIPKDSSRGFYTCTNDGIWTIEGDYDCNVSADTEANARAKALIWLIENKHIEV